MESRQQQRSAAIPPAENAFTVLQAATTTGAELPEQGTPATILLHRSVSAADTQDRVPIDENRYLRNEKAFAARSQPGGAGVFPQSPGTPVQQQQRTER